MLWYLHLKNRFTGFKLKKKDDFLAVTEFPSQTLIGTGRFLLYLYICHLGCLEQRGGEMCSMGQIKVEILHFFTLHQLCNVLNLGFTSGIPG